LYSLSGKLAAIIGPWIWAGTVQIFASYGNIFKYKAAIFALNLLIVVGLVIMVTIAIFVAVFEIIGVQHQLLRGL
jgi:MFS-type transporter involved in bile tolerance (Atg22 family)